MFWLECNHDSLTINITTNGETKQLWKGGCHRDGDFVVSTPSGIDYVILEFVSDQNITYEGMALHYESVDASDAVQDVTVPCPLTSSGLCSLNGACRKGTCSCFSGFVGESCSNAVICPEDVTACTLSTCDPICFESPGDVIVVSVNGDDTQGTGQLMGISESGNDPKAVQSLRRALELAKPNQTILLYPGVYRGVGNCSVTISTSNILIRGLRGQTITILDCQSLWRGLTISGVSVQLVGFTLQNTLVSNSNGAAISATSAGIQMQNVYVKNGKSLQNGGGIYAYRSNLKLISSKLSNCSATAKGGAIFMDNSNLTISQSIIELSSANEGGGLYAQNNVTVQGDDESTIRNNTAALNGGGICVWGSLTGTMLSLLQNNASVGAGMAASSGSSILSQVNITQNRALNDGGGIALLNTASLILYYSPIQMNHAERYGGGVYVGSNGTFENKAASEIFNCTAGKRIDKDFSCFPV